MTPDKISAAEQGSFLLDLRCLIVIQAQDAPLARLKRFCLAISCVVGFSNRKLILAFEH